MPTIRLAFLPLLLWALSLSACASLSVEQQVEQMEDRQAEYRLLDDLRFALLEKRLGNLETAVEAVRNQLAGIPPRKRAAKRAAPAARVAAPPTASDAPLVSAAPSKARPEAVKPAPTSPTPAPTPTTKIAPASPAPKAESSPATSPAPVSVLAAHAATPQAVAPEAARPAEAAQPEPSRPRPTTEAAASPPKSPTPRTALTPPNRAAKAAYDAALALYYKGQYTQSEDAFDDFLERFPSTRLTPNALYWQGECFYSQGKFDTAIMSFKDVAGKFPKHDKAAASLLKAGYAYAELNDMENARFYWRILLDDFPGSTPAKLAQRRLEGR